MRDFVVKNKEENKRAVEDTLSWPLAFTHMYIVCWWVYLFTSVNVCMHTHTQTLTCTCACTHTYTHTHRGASKAARQNKNHSPGNNTVWISGQLQESLDIISFRDLACSSLDCYQARGKTTSLLFESVSSTSWIRSSHPKEYFQLNGNNLSNTSNSLQDSTLIDGHFCYVCMLHSSLFNTS